MKRHLQTFKDFLAEAKDPGYYQETFYFTMLISMAKEKGGSRDETKNDIRAFAEVLTVTLVEKEKGGVQKDLGNSYLSTLKIHVRRPRDISKDIMMKRVVKQTARLKGVSVLRYKERKPTQRKRAFRGPGSYKLTELDYQKVRRQKAGEYAKDKAEYISTGPQKTGGAPFSVPASTKRGKSAPPGFGAIGEAVLDEAMKTPADLPEDIVVVVDKDQSLARFPAFKIYYALQDDIKTPLKAGDLDRMEAGIDLYGVIKMGLGRRSPYDGKYLVTSVNASNSYGPLLYDIAMELAGDAGLKPDIDSVSPEASAVWRHYDDSRGTDVESEILVDDEYAYEEVMPPEHAAAPKKNQHLAKAYYWKGNISRFNELGNKLIRLDKESEIEDGPLYEDVLITIGQEPDELMAFALRSDLNQKIWDGDSRVRPGVKGALMDIVEEFLEGLDLDLDIKDVVVTGSTANYNWSRFSDIDLHILIDFAEVNDNKEMVKKFFDAVRSNWNKLHDIKVKGHEVEIYVQDEHEPHVSTGVYSLVDDRWLVKPKKIKPEIDRKNAQKKAAFMAREIGKVQNLLDTGDYEQTLLMAQRLKDKIKKMRKAGLEETGIYAPENLAFKMLRRAGTIGILHDAYTQAYDLSLSLDQ